MSCTAPKQSSNPDYTIIKQLQIDHENGNISKDDYYTYLTYSVFAQELLPKKYNGKLGKHDASPTIMKIKRAFPTLSPKTQKHLRQWISPLPPKPTKQGVKQ